MRDEGRGMGPVVCRVGAGSWEVLQGTGVALQESSHQGHPGTEGLTARDSIGTVPGSKTRDLVSVPAEETPAGMSCGARDPMRRSWPGGGHREWCHTREPWGLGPPSRHPPPESGISPAPLPTALSEGCDPAWRLCNPLSSLFSPQRTHPEVFLNEELQRAVLGPALPLVSERTVRFQNMFAGLGRGVPDLLTALWLLGPRLFPAEAHADNKHRFFPSCPWLWSLPPALACGQ